MPATDPQLPAPAVTQLQFWRWACREYFPIFFLYGFGARHYCADNPADNWYSDSIHWDILMDLDGQIKDWEKTRNTGARVPKKILVCIPRGWGKSTIGCALDCWLQLRNPGITEVIDSYDEDKAKEFLEVNANVIAGESQYGWWRDLYGSWRPTTDDGTWRKNEIKHNRRPNRALRDASFSVASISSGLTGARPDVFRMDDPIVEEKITTQGNWIERARNHLDSAVYAVKTNGLFLVYLTRYADNDIAGKIMLEEKVDQFAPYGMKPRNPDSYKEGKGPWHVIFYSAELPDGTPTFPEVWPRHILDGIREKDPRGYACQMLNEPAEVSYMSLTAEHIDKMWIQPHKVPATLQYSIHVDTAFKYDIQQNRGDYSVIQIWGHEPGTGVVYYIDGRRSKKWDSKLFIDNVVDMLQGLFKIDHWPFVFTDERIAGHKEQSLHDFIQGELRRAGLPGLNILALTRTGGSSVKNRKDDVRVRNACYGWLSNKVRLVRGAGGVEDLVYEMLHIGTSANDDMRDAAADVMHPLVYRAFAGLSDDSDQPMNTRPYDELMWAPPGTWTDDEQRQVYDHDPTGPNDSVSQQEFDDWEENPWMKDLTL